jgi:hypothetical protein
MREPLTRGVGLAVAVAYAGLIAWLFASQPQTMAEAVGGLAANVGAYAIDAQSFAEGLSFFRRDQFVEARSAFARADPASRDPQTQFYIAYSYYRQGWHRTHHDDELFKQGLTHVDRAIALSADGRVLVDDANLQMRSADELKAELQAGLTHDASDFNPLRLLRERR